MRTPPEYLMTLLENRVNADAINRRTRTLPKYDPRKKNLPRLGAYLSVLDWLRAIRECVGGEIVFALDEALMCHQLFLGRDDEYVVWAYGDDSLLRFNGVVLLGNRISPYAVTEKFGILCTDLTRTINDAFANEDILDMQGITEAVSMYYFEHGESFAGISVAPEYQDRFEKLARNAMEYYNS